MWIGHAYIELVLPISNEYDEWHAVTKFVRTRRRARSVCAGEFVEKPMRWRTEALLVLFPASGQLQSISITQWVPYGPRPIFADDLEQL